MKLNWYDNYYCQYCLRPNLFSNESGSYLHECIGCGKQYESRIEYYANCKGEHVRVFLCYDNERKLIFSHSINRDNHHAMLTIYAI